MTSSTPTLRDVAAEAGVSPMTASNALRGKPGVKESTRAKVIAAAKKLNYRINLTASMLKSGRSNIIHVIVNEFDSPFYSKLTQALSNEIVSRGLIPFIEQTQYSPDAAEHALSSNPFSGQLFDGEILHATGLGTNVPLSKLNGGRPFVLLDACEEQYLPQLALDYARVERCAPGEAAPRVRALIQQQRDALEEMSTLIREIDASHVRYRKRAVQRAQFLLLSDRSAQGSVTALLRRYAENIKTPDQLFEPDDGPLAARLKLWPVQVFGEKPLYPPAAPRTDAPLAPVQAGQLDEEQLRREQKLLLDYARMAVTEENVDILARQALAARPSVSASTLADEYPNDFARIIGLHTYSQSPRRCYDIQLTGKWATRGGFRFEEFTLTPRKEDAEDDRNE